MLKLCDFKTSPAFELLIYIYKLTKPSPVPFACFCMVVLQGYPMCPDRHDLSECHHLYDLGRHKSSPSYKFNSLNFDSEKISVITVQDHLKMGKSRKPSTRLWQNRIYSTHPLPTYSILNPNINTNPNPKYQATLNLKTSC